MIIPASWIPYRDYSCILDPIQQVVYRLSFKDGKGDDWEAALKSMREKLVKDRVHK
jgi:hypothetical protein